MIRLLVALAGLAIGGAFGIGIILSAPTGLLGGMSPEPADTGVIIALDERADQGMELTLANMLGVQRLGLNSSGFAEPGIGFARVTASILPDIGTGERGIALRLSAISERNRLLDGRLAMSSYWNIVWPGQGGLLVADEENYWEVFRDQIQAVMGAGVYKKSRYLLSELADITRLSGVFGATGLYSDSSAVLQLSLEADETTGEPTREVILFRLENP